MRFKRFKLKGATFPGERMRLLKFNLVKNSLIDEQAGRSTPSWPTNKLVSKHDEQQT